MERIIRWVGMATIVTCVAYAAYAQRQGAAPPGGGAAAAAAQGAARKDAPLPDDDPDYQGIYRYLPKEDFLAAREQYMTKTKKPPFEFPELKYPKGDKNPTEYRFDFGPADGPVKAGYTKVTKSDVFSWEKGFGWAEAPAAGESLYKDKGSLPTQKLTDYDIAVADHVNKEFEKRGKDKDANVRLNLQPQTFEFYDKFLDDGTRDAVLNPEELAFKVALPNGRYRVSAVIGDVQLPRYGMELYANGDRVISDPFSAMVQWRGTTSGSAPWPQRISFPARVVRNTLRIALRANENLFLERAEVGAETPDFNFSQLPYVMGLRDVKPAAFFGKQMNLHGPATQMALAEMTITPWQAPPLELVRQKIAPAESVKDAGALAGVEAFNKGDLKTAEERFAKIPDSEPLLKACAYLALAGHLETELPDEQRWCGLAAGLLEKQAKAKPEDIDAADLLHLARFYKEAAWKIEHAAELGVSQGRAEASCLLSWIGPNDILYSKALMRYGRCFSSIDAHRWSQTWHVAEETFTELENREPGNRFSAYFLGWDAKGWGVPDYTSDAKDAPRWAKLMREAYNRLLDQAEWWRNNRQLPDGRLGGGWGDDVEINIVWQSVMLMNPDASKEAMEAVRALTEGVWWGGEVDRDTGYFDGQADVEHTAEWTGDSQALIQGIDYGNPTYYERSLKTAKLMRDLWTGVNEKGHRHFKSMVLGNKTIGKSYNGVEDAEIDHPLNGRALLPAFWAWWYSPTTELDGLFTDWANAWWEDSRRAENGKPEWVIPGPIGYFTDGIGGNKAPAWRQGAPQGNAYENPTYAEFIMDLFSRMFSRTGDAKWLQPKAATLTPKEVKMDRLQAVRNPDEGFAMKDKYAAIDQADLEFLLDIVRKTWPSITSEVASTDRIAMPGLNPLLKILTGGSAISGLDFIPATFRNTSRNVAFMCLASSSRGAKTILYNFSPNPETVNMCLWNLQVGAEHKVTIGMDNDDDDKVDQTLKEFTHKQVHRGDSLSFEIPSRKAVIVEVARTKDGPGMPKQVVDLAISRDDIRLEGGNLGVTIHNIGNIESGPFTAEVWQGEPGKGTKLGSFDIADLEAPNDLEPRRLTKTIAWALPAGATKEKPVAVTVVLDPGDKTYEITERNNTATRAFPFEEPAYRVPKVWKSLAAEEGIEQWKPFPADYPRDKVR